MRFRVGMGFICFFLVYGRFLLRFRLACLIEFFVIYVFVEDVRRIK